MKVLLVGEYSGLHFNLYEGLSQYKYLTVDLMSDGDGFKGFGRNIDIKGYTTNKIMYTITRVFKEIVTVLFLPKYDIIQIINPLVFSRFGPSLFLMFCLRKKAKKIVLLAVGDDYYYWKSYRENKFNYSPHKDILKIDKKTSKDVWESKRLQILNNYVVKICDAIVPGASDYVVGYIGNEKLKSIIKFPINIEKIIIHKINIEKNDSKIKILHGVQKGREGFKGTHYVDQAMNEILKKHSETVEYIRPVSVPFNEYIKLLGEADIVIDQVNSLEAGMNGLFSLVMGKIVVGGNEDILNLNPEIKSPVFNITPNVSHIVEVIEKLIARKNEFKILSQKSQEYVEKIHSHIKIAKEFKELYQKI
ncbi:glycosyltransferase [Flavobacterium sp.]|uniref:glycosyltransferase n=1 Tax=Flavobacterium sp. TaxID=239 RepID=UPI0037513C70